MTLRATLLNNRTSIKIDTPCKVNLSLSVGERREDGFHNVKSIFAAFTLCDTLKFETDFGADGYNDDEILLDASELPRVLSDTLDPYRLPPEKNIVYRSIKLFKHESGFDKAVKVHIYKRIPPAAGLGGGSSDAAASLLAMNRLYGLCGFSGKLGGDQKPPALEPQKLLRMAEQLGSDVPFFLELAGQRQPENRFAAFVSGRGEHIEFAAAPYLNIVIVNPGIESGTKEAFALLDKARYGAYGENEGGKTFLSEKTLSKSDLLAALQKNPAEWPFNNDFLTVFLKTPPQNEIYNAILQDLTGQGALFCGLSGSGSSCFGIFSSFDLAKSAAGRLSGRWPLAKAAHSFSAGSFLTLC
ncbi:MAG: 4-(cytidine 5'-diphospho)-2-C-methyl-D-erythritol kinase [Spirochaetaceae bacterium]|nr:4-(cytidine 5'-diphospho)-2-C-methyl-D-erythritol kinase [Spirochaetaceae bacterium]